MDDKVFFIRGVYCQIAKHLGTGWVVIAKRGDMIWPVAIKEDISQEEVYERVYPTLCRIVDRYWERKMNSRKN